MTDQARVKQAFERSVRALGNSYEIPGELVIAREEKVAWGRGAAVLRSRRS